MSLPTKTVVITPNQSFNPGNARLVLSQLNCGPIVEQKNGDLQAKLTDDQIAMFRLKGPMHKIHVVEPEIEIAHTSGQALVELQAEVAAWKAAAECDTPGQLSEHLAELMDEVKRKLDELSARDASQLEIIVAWQHATGAATPGSFTAGFDVKPKAK